MRDLYISDFEEETLDSLTASPGKPVHGAAALSIEEDIERLEEILKGKAREEIRKYISNGEMIARKGDETVSVPVPSIDLPRFVYYDGEGGGEGEGTGEPGEGREAGDAPGERILEVEISIEELADILGEELELPRIEPKQNQDTNSEAGRYTGISNNGPNSLRQFKRSYREALKREIASGEYDPRAPEVVPIKEDLRFRERKPTPTPDTNAVIFHIMDSSGSMGNEQKYLARSTSFWTDSWIEAHYDNSVHVFITHDTEAEEVDRETFFTRRESGGTRISSAYEKVKEIIEKRFSPEQWNIYVFHYSDGDNLSVEDSAHCLELLDLELLPIVNLFAYGQVKSRHGSGKFGEALNEALSGSEKVVSAEIPHRRAIPEVIKKFLSTGK